MARTKLEKRVWEMFEQGMTDNEILNTVVTEQGEALTYMDLRMLRADYEAEHPETIEEEEEPETIEEEETDAEETGITIDSIKKPGALISGSASLPSGAKINWALDQMGRINIIPQGETQPTQEDMQAFQESFKKELEKKQGLF
jgi:hypothetical protein